MKKLILLLLLIPILGFSQKAHVTAYNTAAAANETYLSQGLTWYQYGHASQGTYARVGSISGFALNASPGNAALPIQSAMRGCLLLDNGKVNYYLSATDWTKKADGVTASVLTGADGQVMVEIPKYYYKYIGGSNAHTWRISLYPLTGYTVHPAFIKDGVEVNHRWIGASEGILYDASDAIYRDGTAAGRGTPDWTNDKLSSVSGKIPISNGTRASFRKIASNRGTGWRQLDFDLVHAVELLALIEYGTFYLQNIAEVGPGITGVNDWASISYYPFQPSGNGNGLGNASGDNAAASGSPYATEAAKYSRYRGIENLYGGLWDWVDGINVNDNVPYVTNNSAVWADDTSTGYTDLSVTLLASNDYQRGLVYSSRAMLPSEGGGSESTYISDYYYQNSGWRVAFVGGAADYGGNAGLWFWRLAYASDGLSAAVGGRLAF